MGFGFGRLGISAKATSRVWLRYLLNGPQDIRCWKHRSLNSYIWLRSRQTPVYQMLSIIVQKEVSGHTASGKR